MILLTELDYYKVIKKSLVADYDIETLTLLYQPIIGSNALSLYLTLLSEAKYQEWIDISTHETLVNKTTLSLLQLSNAKEMLEGIGLLKSYRKVNKDELSSYVYELYAPKTPALFFHDPIFYGLLESSVGEKECARLRRIFKLNEFDLSTYLNVSSSFQDVYSNISLKTDDDKSLVMNRSITPLKNNFDCLRFKKYLIEDYGILKEKVDEQVVMQVMRIATLFNYTENQMAGFVSKHYDPNNINPFDIADIYKDCRDALIIPLERRKSDGYKVYKSEAELAKKVNLMNDMSSLEYFKMQSNGVYPSPSDITIINILSRDYKLNDGVINVIIDYTLRNCNQDFPKAYCEKIGAKLARLNVKNAMEALNALEGKKIERISKVKEIKNVEAEEEKEEISDEELRKMIEDL